MAGSSAPARTPYVAAAAAVAVAIVIRLLLDPILGTAAFPFATVFFAVLISAWQGGFGPALFASGLGAAASSWFLLPPRHTFAVTDPENGGGLLLYAAVSAGIALIGGAMHRSREKAEDNEHAADTERERLRVTLGSIGDAVITTDMRGRISTMNAVATDLTGWSAADAIGRPLAEVFRIINEETRAPVWNPVETVLAEGRIVGLANHTLLIDRSGNERPIDDSAAPIRDRDGVMTGVVLVFRDVTEARRAADVVRRSEKELSDFFENANVGLHFVGPDGILLRANNAELELLGYEREEYVGRHIADFHADRDVIDELLRRLAAGETLEEYSARLRAKDGSIKDVLINATVRQEDGRFVYARCFTLDVTQRRRAEEAQARLAAVVESSDDAIVTKTLEGVITSWNGGAERIFGHSASEAIGQPITLIIPVERRAEEREILARLKAGERIDHYETVRVAKDGRRLDISLTISPLRDASGRVVGASKVARDVTARHAAVKALRESEERFRDLADNIAQLAWMADGSGSIVWYNRRWFEYTGTSFEEVKGSGWQSAVHPDHLEHVRETVARCLASGEVWEDTFPLRGADGSYRWFLARGVPIRDESGRLVRWFGTATDIESQREAEEALRTADRRKDEFLATLAHELRNPLAPIRNSIEIMKRANGNADLIARAQATMDRQAAHLERLVDDLLDIARISRDRLELRREQTELASIVYQALETCRPLAEASGVDLSVDVPPEPIYVDADAVRLAQVFTNLLNNSCKYSEAGDRVHLSVKSEGADAVVTVRDTGFGIPPEMLSSIFDMFTQVEQSRERSRSGLGIGLTLVRRLVELHGGTVEARSEGLGRGSEFVVRVPRLTKAAGVPPTRPSVERQTQRRILVVDDNTDAAESLAMLLEMTGHVIHVAHDGADAIAAAESFRPDVVLLDIGLPTMSGHDAARRIRAEPWGKGMTLVALTGWGQDVDRRRSKEVGFDHHLVKPVDVAALMQLLREPRPPSTEG